MSNFFLSLFLSAFVSFSAPVLLIAGVLGFLLFTSHIPGFLAVSNQGMSYIWDFLAVFGEGKSLQGVITVGITASIAGILLDILNFYRYQSLQDEDFS